MGAVAILTLLAVLIGGLRLLEKSEETTEATSVAREQMERIKAGSYPHALGNEVFDGRVPDATVEEFPPAPYPKRQGKFTYYTRVAVRPLDAVRFDVVVQVYWNQKSSLEMECVVTR